MNQSRHDLLLQCFKSISETLYICNTCIECCTNEDEKIFKDLAIATSKVSNKIRGEFY